MNILITGASGFIGQHLLEMFDFEAHNVSVLTRNPDRVRRIQNESIKVIQGDLNDYASLEIALKNINCVVNIAAEVRDVSKLMITNVQGIKNLIQAMSHNNVKKVIHISSVGVVGRQYNLVPEKVDERTLPEPKNEYEKSKLESEKLFLEFEKESDVKLVILRPTNVYGEFHPFNAVLNLTKHIVKYRFVLTTKFAKVNYVYVKDVCTVILACIQSDKYKGILNVGHSEYLCDFSKSIAKEFKQNVKIVIIPIFFIRLLELLKIKKLRSVTNAVEYDSTIFQQILKDTNAHNNGLSVTINYFRSNKLLT